MIPAPTALARRLRPLVVAPTWLAGLLGGDEAFARFRQIVKELFPDTAAEILAAREPNGDREASRVWAFCDAVQQAYFPIHEGSEYEHVAFEIPFVRYAWSSDRYHDLDVPVGELLLLTLCASPYAVDDGTRVALFDAASVHVPADLLREVPDGGLEPDELRQRLDGTPYAPAADFADWLWWRTGSAFLDVDEESVVDVPWTHENVAELTAQWRDARALLDRVTGLERWLEADPPTGYARLLDAALGRDPHATYLRERTHYEWEITERGLVRVADHDPVALPVGAAA